MKLKLPHKNFVLKLAYSSKMLDPSLPNPTKLLPPMATHYCNEQKLSKISSQE